MDRRKRRRNNNATLGQGPSSSSRDIYNNIFSSSTGTKIPAKWKMLTIWWNLFIQRKSQSLITLRTTGPLIRTHDARWAVYWRNADPACTWSFSTSLLLEPLLKNSASQAPWNGTHSLEVISLLWPPLPSMASFAVKVKLFFSISPFTEKLCWPLI